MTTQQSDTWIQSKAGLHGLKDEEITSVIGELTDMVDMFKELKDKFSTDAGKRSRDVIGDRQKDFGYQRDYTLMAFYELLADYAESQIRMIQ